MQHLHTIIAGWGWQGPQGPSGPIPLLQQGHLKQGAQNHIWVALEISKRKTPKLLWATLAWSSPIHLLEYTVGFYLGLERSPPSVKVKSSGLHSFLLLCCYFVRNHMELFKPVVTVYSFQQLWGCGDEHRASVSDTDRSHTVPKEMPKCYKDEPYGQPQHSRPLIGIFKQLWLMGQLLQVWDQWKCNLIFWT